MVSPQGSLAVSSRTAFEHGRRGVGPPCSFCGTSTGPFQHVEGRFTVLMWASCQAARQASSTELLAQTIPGVVLKLTRNRSIRRPRTPAARHPEGAPEVQLKRFAPSSDVITAHHRLRPQCRRNE